jgi:hypothetical protein
VARRRDEQLLGVVGWRSVMVVGLLSMAAVLIAMGWFAIGWVARGHENRKYAESRLRHFANQALQHQLELAETSAHWESERVYPERPTVVNVYLAATGIPAQPQPPVVDARVIPALPSGKGARLR